MDILSFRDALAGIGKRFWSGRDIQSAPVIKLECTDSLTEEYNEAMERGGSHALARILAPGYIRAGNSDVYPSLVETLGCCYRLPFRELIVHAWVKPEDALRTDSMRLIVDTGNSAYPDVVTLGLFWKDLADTAVVLSRGTSLEKNLSLWDMRRRRQITGGSVFKAAMRTLEDYASTQLSQFSHEQIGDIRNLDGAILLTEMAAIRPVLYRLHDPQRQYARIIPLKKNDGRDSLRERYEVISIGEAIGHPGEEIQLLEEKPTYETPSGEETNVVRLLSCIVGKEKADDEDWVIIAPSTGDMELMGRLLERKPGAWEFRYMTRDMSQPANEDTIGAMIRKQLIEMAALKLIKGGNAESLKMSHEPLRPIRTAILMEPCPGCRAHGKIHPSYGPVPLAYGVDDVEVGEAFDSFMHRWATLRPDIGGH